MDANNDKEPMFFLESTAGGIGGYFKELFLRGDKMDANQLEQSYQEVMLGRDEPEVMWILGRTLKEWANLSGRPCTETNEGYPIEDGCFYMVTSEGVWLVE